MNKVNLNQNQLYIDKTEELQKGIEGFPFVYIEGFAAYGKSTAVKMLLEKHPAVESYVVNMNVNREPEKLKVTLDILRSWMQEKDAWVIFENMNHELGEESGQLLERFLKEFLDESMQKLSRECIAEEKETKNGRILFVGRACPDKYLLPFVWKRQMEIIPQEALLFTRAEIQKLIAERDCAVSAKDIYEQTGGWAGCVDMMLRLAKRQEKYSEGIIDAKELRSSYEIEQYIQYTIMDALGDDEKGFLEKIIFCPFVNEKLCEDIFEMEDAKALLESLRRKGILVYDAYRKCWKVAKAFRVQNEWGNPEMWKQLAEWYAKEGYIREAAFCMKNTKDEAALLEFLQEYYDRIEPVDIPGEMILSKKKSLPEMYYLQGLYNYMHQDFYGLDREIVRLEKMNVADAFSKYEMLLNLYYLKPDFTTSQWMELLVKYGEMFTDKKFRLYHMLGYSHTYLCGLRDLSGLFACSKKEENQNARNWKTFLEEEEWKCYQLAKVDYYLETERRDKISEEEWGVLCSQEDGKTEKDIVRLYLSGKLMRTNPTVENEEHFLALSNRMKGYADDANIINAIIRLYSHWTKESHLMAYWLRYSENIARAEINEQNYAELCFMMKGYLQLNQFEKTERIVKKMIPYLQKYHRTMLLTEILFQQAIVSWETDRHGQALQNIIESFVVGAPYRYVGFYTNYGQNGKEVLEAYEEWCRTNIPEKWRRKKKYQYGNVLRMPEADYVGVILRLAHKGRNAGQKINKKSRIQEADMISAERLTMMETMVLQAISRGCTNAEICEELNLKLPTVKTHVYSLYKKLGVNSRVQAANKGKEMGLVKS